MIEVRAEEGRVWVVLPGSKARHLLTPQEARMAGGALLEQAAIAEGRPQEPCANCGITSTYDVESGWHCTGCGLTREEAERTMSEIQGAFDV